VVASRSGDACVRENVNLEKSFLDFGSFEDFCSRDLFVFSTLNERNKRSARWQDSILRRKFRHEPIKMMQYKCCLGKAKWGYMGVK